MKQQRQLNLAVAVTLMALGLLVACSPLLPVHHASAAVTSFDASDNDVLCGESVLFTLVAQNTTMLIENATVTFTAPYGMFPASTGPENIIEGLTDGAGNFSAEWIAPYLETATDEVVVQAWVVYPNGTSNENLYETVVVTRPNSLDMVNSSIVIADPMEAGTTDTVLVRVADADNVTQPYIAVLLTSDAGVFLTANDGTTNETGYFEALWRAPWLNEETLSVIVNFTATIDTGMGDPLDIECNVTVDQSSADTLTLTAIPSTLSAESGEMIQFLIHAVVGDDIDAFGTELSISAGSGNFTVDGSMLLTIFTNGTGYALVNWTAPSVTMNTTDDILVHGSFGEPPYELEDDLSLNVPITYFEPQLVLTWMTPGDLSLFKNETAQIVLVISVGAETVEDVTVSFLTDVGFWEGTGTQSCSLVSNSNGVVSATLNASNEELLDEVFDSMNASITASASKAAYQDAVSEALEVTFLRIEPVFDFSLTKSADTVTPPDLVTITAMVLRNNVPRVSVTIEAVVTHGEFQDGSKILRILTDASGEAVFVWNSSAFAGSIVERTIHISFTARPVGEPEILLTESIVVAPGSTSETSSTGDGDGDDDGFMDAMSGTEGIVAGAVVLGAIGVGTTVMLLKKKS